MRNPLKSSETWWMIIATAAAVGAGILTRAGLKGAYRLTHQGNDPPQNPSDPDADWGETLLFMGLTGAAVGVARLLARQGAAKGWRRVTGSYPQRLFTH